jgi:hypothetical protein
MNYGSLQLGAGKYVAIPVGEATHIIPGTNDFTIEAWVYPTDYAYTASIVSMDTPTTSGTGDWFFGIDNDAGGNLMFGINTTDNFSSTGQQVPLNQWSHVAVTRNGSTLDTWVNGVKSTASVTNTTNLSVDGELRIGRGRVTSSNYFKGWVAGVRIIVGEALFTGEFTPPTAPLTNTANTKFLLSSEYAADITDVSSYTKTLDKYNMSGMSTFNPWSEPTTVAGLTDWDTIKVGMYTTAIKILNIPDDPIVDETVIETELGFDSYTL